MDLQFHGANCVSISTGKARIVIDDNLADLGSKPVTKQGDITLFTAAHGVSKQEPKIVIDRPGEYEVSEVSIYGIPMRAHIDEEKQKTVTSYKLIANDLRVLVLGHVYPELNERDLETIGMVDVLFTPVGGNGFTLDPTGAASLIKKIEPKLVIPTYYEDASLKFPVPAQSLEQALQGIGIEPKERTTKLKVKAGDLSDVMQLIVLERS